MALLAEVVHAKSYPQVPALTQEHMFAIVPVSGCVMQLIGAKQASKPRILSEKISKFTHNSMLPDQIFERYIGVHFLD